MSVALPVAAVVFGSVTPPQGDIVDLTVHLGCSTEISSFECTLQNWDKKYSDGGTYPIVEGSSAIIYVGRSPNCPLLLTGMVEETDPESRATEHYIIVRGRCNGEQLFRRHVTKSWDNVKGEVVVKYVIDNYTSLSHVRNSVELIEDTDTTYTYLEYDDTPVFDILKYIAETADKAGAIGFDFRIAPDGKFEFFPKNSKTSPVDLSERLEVGRHKRSITRIKNRIKVYGAAERPEPIDRDIWTEPTQDPPENWVAVSTDTTITRSAVDPKSGIYRVLAVKGTYGTLDFYRSVPSLKVEKGTSLKFWAIYGLIITGFQIRLRAPDASNYFERTIDLAAENVYHFYELPTGRGTEFDAITNPNGTWIKVGSPSWSDIQGIEFLVSRPAGPINLAVDGMFFDKFRWKYVAEDIASQTQYGLRERPPEIDEELHSDKECEYRAKALLDFLKGPIITPKARSTVIDYGLTPILAADKTHITLPNENVDADYRLISVEYNLVDPTILEIELELAKEPQLLADFIYGFRKSIQKLDKYKASASAGVVSSGGGGGGSGMAQHGNEYHDPDMALASHNHNLNDLAEKSHTSLTDKGTNTHTQIDTHLTASAPHSGHEQTANKGAASGYAPLDTGSKVPAANMPSTTIKTTLSFAVVGTLTVGVDKAPTIVAPCSLTITKVKLVVKTAPTGQAIIVDVNKNGTTIFTTQANRPQIAAGATQGDSGTPDVTALAEGDKLTIDIDQIGSTIAGADLTVEVVCTQAITWS